MSLLKFSAIFAQLVLNTTLVRSEINTIPNDRKKIVCNVRFPNLDLETKLKKIVVTMKKKRLALCWSGLLALSVTLISVKIFLTQKNKNNILDKKLATDKKSIIVTNEQLECAINVKPESFEKNNLNNTKEKTSLSNEQLKCAINVEPEFSEKNNLNNTKEKISLSNEQLKREIYVEPEFSEKNNLNNFKEKINSSLDSTVEDIEKLPEDQKNIIKFYLNYGCENKTQKRYVFEKLPISEILKNNAKNLSLKKFYEENPFKERAEEFEKKGTVLTHLAFYIDAMLNKDYPAHLTTFRIVLKTVYKFYHDCGCDTIDPDLKSFRGFTGAAIHMGSINIAKALNENFDIIEMQKKPFADFGEMILEHETDNLCTPLNYAKYKLDANTMKEFKEEMKHLAESYEKLAKNSKW